MEAAAKEQEQLIALRSGEEALQHAIKAAELYMKALAEAPPDGPDKVRLSRKCRELLALAEKLKKAETSFKEPRSTRQLPTAEKILLLRSSKLHGNTFPPWESSPPASAFLSIDSEMPLYTDPASFPLSPRQLQVFDGWKRPSELFAETGSFTTAIRSLLVHDTLPSDPMTRSQCDLVQDITTDCSVVASLCAAVRHLDRSKDSLLRHLMYPLDDSSLGQAASENGKYVFRMHFNGCFRNVVIDDRLPSSSNERALFVTDRQNPQLIWPALIEKAYLKVRGGYDFPGSNSGTDLSVITGWIPEQISLQSGAEFDADAAWDRIKKAFDFGDVMITLGTGHITPEEQGSLGLVGEHDYAVLDLETGSDSRRLLLKNPWFDGLVWTGAGSIAERGTNPKRKHGLTGIFWMTLEDVEQNFESMYLNWNPSLFTDRRDHHFSWDMPGPTVALTLAPNPQFAFRAGRDGSVWILLSRHFLDDELAIARRRSVSSLATMAAVSSRLGFIRLYLFDKSDGKRVLLPDGAVQRGPWVDSPQTLLRLEAKANTTYTVVAGQEGLPLPKYTFSLSFFSRGPLSAQAAAEPLPHVAETLGAWTRRSSGGNSSTSSYFDNPQYRISVCESTPITLLLSTADANLPIHISLVWAKGQRVVSLASRDIVATSGEYRRGVALCRIPAPTNPGDYTAVVSTFDKGSLADFTLRAAANCPVEVTPIAADGADRFRKTLPPLNFPSGGSQQQPRVARAALHVSVTTKIVLSIIRISLDASGTVRPGSTAVRASLEMGHGIHRRTLAATGTEFASGHDEPDFLDATMGLRTPETHVHVDDVQRAGGIWILVELMGRPVSEQGLRVEVLGDMPVDVGSWEYVDG